MNLIYEQGVFRRGATRGDGTEGEDITANLLTLAELPRELPAPFPERIEIRGEVFMTKADFLAFRPSRRGCMRTRARARPGEGRRAV